MTGKHFLRLCAIVAFLLSIPLAAMQFTNNVNWDISDFIIAGGLFLGTGVLIHLIVKKIKHSQLRKLLILFIVVILVLIWVELAVGIFGTPFSGS